MTIIYLYGLFYGQLYCNSYIEESKIWDLGQKFDYFECGGLFFGRGFGFYE